MAASIGSLAAMLTANDKGFNAGIDAASKKLGHFGKELGKLAASPFNLGGKLLGAPLAGVEGFLKPIQAALSSIPLIGGALGALPASGGEFISFVKQGADEVLQLDKAAKQVGTSTENMAGFMKIAGGDGEAMVTALAHMNKELGALSAGDEGATKKFAKLGFGAEDFQGLGTKEAYGKIADKTNTFSSAADKATTRSDIFGKGFLEIIPALNKGSAGLDAATEKMQSFGKAVSAVDAAQVRNALAPLKDLDDVIDGLKRQLAVQLAPFVGELTSMLKSGLSGANMKDAVAGGLEDVAHGIAFVLDSVHALGTGLSFLKLGFMELANRGLAAVQMLLEGLGQLPDNFGGAAFRSAAEEIGFLRTGIAEVQKEIGEDISKRLADPSALARVNEFFDNVKKKSREAAEAATKSPENAGESVADIAKNNSLTALAAKIQDILVTPLQKFDAQMKELDELVNSGKLTLDTADLARGKAFSEMAAKALPKLVDKGPEAALFGSKEAFSAIDRLSNNNNRDPVEELQAIRKINEAQLKIAEEMGRKLGRQELFTEVGF